jgi:hypothetical protein
LQKLTWRWRVDVAAGEGVNMRSDEYVHVFKTDEYVHVFKS